MNINPGDLNKRIEIHRPSSEQNRNGYVTDGPTLVCHRWAKFARDSGTEIAKADGSFSTTRARFLIRYTSTPITRDMIVVYAGDTYRIEYINNYGDSNDYIEIIAEKVEGEHGSV